MAAAPCGPKPGVHGALLLQDPPLLLDVGINRLWGGKKATSEGEDQVQEGDEAIWESEQHPWDTCWV